MNASNAAADPGTAGGHFRAFASDARIALEERLGPWLRGRAAEAEAISEEVGAVASAVVELTLRGGKRLRAALVAAGFEAGRREQGAGVAWGACVPAMIAVELLQTYLLIHDDWMDDDAVRRGGPAVHVLLRERFGSREAGDTAAILAGDLASGYAQSALFESAVPADRLLRAARAYARIQVEVVSGQVAEFRAPVRSGLLASTETVHTLKTASYTTTGPLLVGAALAGADDAFLGELERFGRPLGVAFQLRDDLLGVFGDPTVTGKPVLNDIRQGKRTTLISELGGSADALLARAFGKTDATDADVEAVVRAMVETGAKSRVEARIRELCDEARRVANAMAVSPSARTLLLGAVETLGDRAA